LTPDLPAVAEGWIMTGTRLRDVVWSMGLSLAFVAGVAVRAEAQAHGTLRFNVKDYAGLSPERLVGAIDTATAIYAAAGVEVGWTYLCLRRCRASTTPTPELTVENATDLTIFIYPDAMTSTAFPRSVMGSTPTGSYVSYAFFDRVVEFASKRKLLIETVLGHVIAHEVGHLLLREGHAEQGLMRAEWFKQDLDLLRGGLLGFSPEQAARIRNRLLLDAAAVPHLDNLINDRPAMRTRPSSAPY
jgi:hypothetical protein